MTPPRSTFLLKSPEDPFTPPPGPLNLSSRDLYSSRGRWVTSFLGPQTQESKPPDPRPLLWIILSFTLTGPPRSPSFHSPGLCGPGPSFYFDPTSDSPRPTPELVTCFFKWVPC